jgi:hypothetical protein
MRMLLLAGMGPYTVNMKMMDGTILAPKGATQARDQFTALLGRPLDPSRFRWGAAGPPLLRPSRGVMPHLSTEAVRSILDTTEVEYEIVDLSDVWRGIETVPAGPFDVVGLSTTFICDAGTFRRIIDWIGERYPEATLVVGGQYSNLKYGELLDAYPSIDYVVRGDAEEALPRLLDAMARRESTDSIPNLAGRGPSGTVTTTPIAYIDIEAHPSPSFEGQHTYVPYESMRGCPFTCRFCSFPFASPEWRFKSAEKICADWAGYARENGVQRILARDSTFTVPPTRFRRLLEMLPDVGVRWDAYSRANVITSPEIVSALERAHCIGLFIGYESMSDPVLKYMDKKVNASQNRRAAESLAASTIDVHGSFMVGYPGETLADFEQTQQFLLEDYGGRFGLHVFSMQDETMPVWGDAARHQLEVTNGVTWKHVGMDSARAASLRDETLRAVRWNSDRALLQQWQSDYQRPLVPEADVTTNQRIEKLIERLAFAPKDLGDGATASTKCHALIEELGALGVVEAA